MGIAEKMTLVFSGSFLLVGLLTGDVAHFLGG